MLADYDSAIAEARLLHSREDGCRHRAADNLYFSIFRKTGGRPSQHSYRLGQLDDVVRATGGRDDTYISQSSFWSFGRKVVNFKQTRAAWVDLDLYNIDRKLDSAMVSEILAHGEMLGIPAPTAVIYSGRGCYLKWIFETPVSQSQLPVWQALQATLTTAYSCLAADFKARDAARVFRLLDTRNSKSGELVKAIDGSGKLYDFGTMCKAVEALRTDLLVEQSQSQVIRIAKSAASLCATMSTSIDRGDVDALKLYSELRQPIMMKGMSEQTLNWSRFCDLRDLFAARGGIKVGERDESLFWMLNFLSHAGVVHSSAWEGEVTELLRAFPVSNDFQPLTDGSMSTLLKRLQDKESGKRYSWRGIEISPLYRPSNDFLIDTFGIQIEEMARLKTIISGEEKRNRVDEKVEGRAQRREARMEWHKEVRDAFVASEKDKQENVSSQAVNITALAKYLGVGRTRVSHFWSALATRRAAGDADLDVGPAQSKKKLRGPAKRDVKPAEKVRPAVRQPKALPSGEEAQACLEAGRLATIVHVEALAVKEAATALALQVKLNGMQERWAAKKINQLIHPKVGLKKPTIEDAPMATNILSKRIALMQAAQGAAAAKATERNIKSAVAPVANRVDIGQEASAPGSAHSKAQAPVWEEGVNADATASWESSTEEDFDARFAGDPGFSGEASLEVKNHSAVHSAQAAAPKGVLSARDRLALAIKQQSLPGKGTERVAPVAARSTPAAAPQPEPEVRNAPTASTPSARHLERVMPGAPLSPSERLRAVSDRAAKLPPMQRESKGSASTKVLIEGGPPAPSCYPDRVEWPSDTIPPGSNYSPEEWDAARVDDAGNAYAVIEIQASDKAMLLQIIKPSEKSRQYVENGVVKHAVESTYPPDVKMAGICSLVSQVYSDCIWVATDAFPKYPGATEGKCVQNGINYRVIRPRVDYLDPNNFFRVSAEITMNIDKPDWVEVEGDDTDVPSTMTMGG